MQIRSPILFLLDPNMFLNLFKEGSCDTVLFVVSSKLTIETTVHIGYKAGGGTRKNWPYNQYGLISDIPMEGPVKRVEWADMS